MRVLLHVDPAPGHLEATLPLARALAGRGHEVVYSAPLERRAELEADGFRCVPVHRRARRGGDPWAELERHQQIADDYHRGAIDAHVRAIDPAVIVADARASSPIQLVAYRHRIPCVQLSLTLSQHLDDRPPLTSALAPDASPLERQGARWLASCLGRPLGPWRSAMAIATTADRLAARFGYPPGAISLETVFAPAFTAIPEVVAAAAALELPGADPGAHVAIPVDVERPEPVAPALAAFAGRGGGDLVLASLGARAASYPHAGRLFEAVIGAMRLRPDRRAVIETGDLDDPSFARLPPNVLRVEAAPRLWLLRRAAALITHAGLLEVREAIALEVPIVAVPQADDQHGNAVRVVHHGAGVAVPAYGASAAILTGALDRALAADRGPLRALAAACRHEEAEQRGVALVERLAAGEAQATKESVPDGLARGAPRALPGEPAAPTAGWMFLGRAGELPAGREPSASLGEALDTGDGAILARVERAGGRLARVATCDAEAILQDYAVWCAEAALAPARDADPERAALVAGYLAEHRALHAAGAPSARLERVQRAALAQAAAHWDRGYGAAALALAGPPDRNARTARREALAHLAHGGDHAAVAARFERELERRLRPLLAGVGARLELE